jgi:AraC family ethanolamine operon transcriptional activator
MTSPSSNNGSLAEISYQDRRSQHQKPAIDTSGVTPASFVIRHDFNDIDELGEVARAWDLDFRQLNRGDFCGSVIQAGTPQLQIARTRLQGVLHQHGSAPAGLHTFAISTDGNISLQWRGHEVGANCILVFPPSRELESISIPDFDMLIVSVTEDSLEAARRRLGVPGSEETMAGVEISCSQGSAIAHLRQRIRGNLAAVVQDPTLLHDPERVENTELEVSDLIVRALNTGRIDHEHHGRLRRRRLVEHAVRLARNNAQDIQSVADLSQESGASTRTLRRGFQERFGVSPKTYLLAQRLIGARRALRSATQQTLVTDVANTWGFWHMDQFAADYKRQFGELPSETQ